MNEHKERLVIISNRLPISVIKKEEEYQLKPGSGGLVTAMAPVLRNRGGIWIGWTGTNAEDEEEIRPLIQNATKDFGYSFEPVFLNQEEVDDFYLGFSNEVIWPLFHDLQAHCRFLPKYFEAYKRVNQKYAKVCTSKLEENDFVWVHDYQLMLLGQELRKEGVKNRLGFFLHIPFPPLDIFLKLPWRFEIIRGLLEYDLIGFQTVRDKRNFIHCMKALLRDVKVKNQGAIQTFEVGDREVRVGCFPISIDFDEFSTLAATREVEKETQSIEETLPGHRFVLCIDRLDYTKGIPYRLEAVRNLLHRYPEWTGQFTMIQVVVPSRQEIPQYHNLKLEIDGLVGEINSEFAKKGWVPIHYMYRSLSKEELLAYYLSCGVALVTPIKDGMNLVSKEYVASNIDNDGVLILSEFAGSAAELHEEALLANPYDICGLADSIIKAFNMPDEEKEERMRKMRRIVKRNNIFKWVESFLEAAISKDLKSFPVTYEYVPEEQPVNVSS